jgi:hypothetical protein
MQNIIEKDSAQSTIEYLVIIGVVVVASLVVVGFLTGAIGSSSEVSTTQSKLFWQSQSLSISDSGVDEKGDTFFVVTNNTGEDITLLGYTANGVERNFTITTPLIPQGEKRVIFISRQNACEGEICSLSNLNFKYTSANGLDKVSNGNDLLIEKQDDVSIAMFTSQQTLVCVNNGDVGQCGSGGSVDVNGALIYDDSNNLSIDPNNKLLYSNSVQSIDYSNRQLKDVSENIVADWSVSMSDYLYAPRGIEIGDDLENGFAHIYARTLSNSRRSYYDGGNDVWVFGKFGNEVEGALRIDTDTGNLYGGIGSTVGINSDPILGFSEMNKANFYDNNIYTTGSVGIGTTTPGKKLEVVGAINAVSSATSGAKAIAINPNATGGSIWVDNNYDPANPTNGWVESISIDGNGIVTMPRQSYVYAYRTSAQTINASTDTNIIYDTEGADTLGEYNPATGVFIARSSGKYLVTATNLWSNTDSGIQYRTHIFKDTTKYISVLDSFAAGFLTQVATATVDLTVGNKIYIQAWQNSSGVETIFSDSQRWTSLTIIKVA